MPNCLDNEEKYYYKCIPATCINDMQKINSIGPEVSIDGRDKPTLYYTTSKVTDKVEVIVY